MVTVFHLWATQLFSETTCMITNVKKYLNQILYANRFIVGMELFPFPMKRLLRNLFQGHFIVSLHYASLECIILHGICTPTYANGRFLVLFFSQKEKLSSPHKRIWWHTIYISCLQSSEKLQRYLFHTVKTFTKNENLRTCTLAS